MPPVPHTPGDLQRRYAVFISYRHADNKEPGRQWATWLHHALEAYEVPRDLVGAKNLRGEPIPASLYPVFRDEEELPADADLTQNIRRALEHSALLVVLCSPRAVASRFVADEIRHFKNLGKSERILGLMIDGEPNASIDAGKQKMGMAPEAECLPEPMRCGVARADGTVDWAAPTEPIAADVRPEGRPVEGWTTGAAYREELVRAGKLTAREIDGKVRDYDQRLELAKLKVIAGALGVPLGTLTQRDKAMQLERARARARTLRWWLAAVGVLAVAAVTAGVVAVFKAQAERRQRELVQEKEVAARKAASDADFAVADFKLEKEDTPGALAYLADALRQNSSNERAMVRTVSLLWNQPFPVGTIRAGGGLSDASFSPDNKWVVTASGDKTVRVWDARTGEPVSEPMRLGDVVRSVCFSPDGKWVLTASYDRTARLWDARTGKPAGPPMRHDLWVNSASFSPDGKWVVTAAWDACAVVWDVQTGKPVSEPMRHHDEVCAARFSPDGRWVVTASEDMTARVWDARTGKPVSAPMQHLGIVFSASFSPDSKYVVTASGDGTAQIWDAQTGQPAGERLLHRGAVFSAQFSPDGGRVVTASGDTTAQLWDAHKGAQIGEPMRHDATVLSANFNPDGRQVVTASQDKTARIWDAETGKPLGEPMRHAGSIVSASFSPNGRWVVTASADKTARVWDAQAGRPPVGLPLRHADAVSSATFSPDGKRIVTAPFDKGAQVWDAETGRPLGDPMRGSGNVFSANFSPDGEWLVTASDDGVAQLWAARTGKPVGEPMPVPGHFASACFSPNGSLLVTLTMFGDGARVWNAHTGKFVSGPMSGDLSANFSPDSRWLVTAGEDCTAQIWDAQTGKPVGRPIQFDGFVASARFSPDGEWVVTADGDDKAARVWNVKTGEPQGNPMASERRVSSASFSPDGKRIVTGSSDGTARLWDAQTGKPLGEPMRHADEISSAEFSPDGRWVLTVSGDKTARIWDAETGKPLGEPMVHEDAIRSASFSPDGKRVLTASEDKTARIWDAIIKSEAAPAWLADLAEAAGGKVLTPTGAMEPAGQDLRHVGEQLRHLVGDDDVSRFGRWYVADPSTRTISPLSAITVPEFVEQRLKENTAASVEEAYEIDPGNPVVLATLAKFTKDKDTALFYCRFALKRARAEGPPEQIERVRAIAKSLFPDLAEFSGAANPV